MGADNGCENDRRVEAMIAAELARLLERRRRDRTITARVEAGLKALVGIQATALLLLMLY